MGVFGSYAVFYKEKIFVDQPITEVVRLIDARQSEINYAKSQLGEDWSYCDFEAWDIFKGRISVSILKCITGFNHYNKQSKMINNNLTGDECPRYL